MCVWHPEADSIRFDSEALNIIYKNKCVLNYLNSPRALGIAGIKGQGKTFLIKAKRISLDSSFTIMPKDAVMIDTIDGSIRLKKVSKGFYQVIQTGYHCGKQQFLSLLYKIL